MIYSNIYLIETRFNKKRIGVHKNDVIGLYNSANNRKKNYKVYWKLIEINKNIFLLQNQFNNKFIEIKNNQILLTEKNFYFKKEKRINISSINKGLLFIFIKLFQERTFTNKYLNLIKKEAIDIIIKYIDLSDKNLNRTGIVQIYKDQNNEELKYSLRSILQYIPWIRKIFILLPNEKVKFLKSTDEINDKIMYIKDKDLLGFDSANIHAFTFNLNKLKKFGISKNFIYMEDDFFIGKSLRKSDFFYYDEDQKKIIPYVIAYHFSELNKTYLFNKYYKIFQKKDLIHPHSGEGWEFSVLNTQKFFTERYKISIINIGFTHNSIPENLDDLIQIFQEIQNYKYINETLFYKERHILTLNQPLFFNLYLLNIKHRRVNSIPYNYIPIESIDKSKLYVNLFVLNTGGNHKPLKRQYLIQKKLMDKRFPLTNKYEIINKKFNTFFKYIKGFNLIFKIFTINNFVKIYLAF